MSYKEDVVFVCDKCGQKFDASIGWEDNIEGEGPMLEDPREPITGNQRLILHHGATRPAIRGATGHGKFTAESEINKILVYAGVSGAYVALALTDVFKN